MNRIAIFSSSHDLESSVCALEMKKLLTKKKLNDFVLSPMEKDMTMVACLNFFLMTWVDFHAKNAGI
jgi:hypothetical protein